MSGRPRRDFRISSRTALPSPYLVESEKEKVASLTRLSIQLRDANCLFLLFQDKTEDPKKHKKEENGDEEEDIEEDEDVEGEEEDEEEREADGYPFHAAGDCCLFRALLATT